MVLLFIGPSGSGKDTQAQFLVNDFGYKRISTGDLIRELVEGEHPTQLRIRNSLTKGFLPDGFVFGLLEIYLEKEENPNLIFSGAVRRITQVELLDNVLSLTGKKVDKVVYFELSDEEAIKRMSSRYRCPKCQRNYNLQTNPPKVSLLCDIDQTPLTQREDDTVEGIKNRLEDFHKFNDDIISEYEKRGVLLKIDASKDIEEVKSDLKELLSIN